MSKGYKIIRALSLFAAQPLLQGAASGARRIVGDVSIVNCEYASPPSSQANRFFGRPYRDGGRGVPQRQSILLATTGPPKRHVAYFADGPALDPQLIKNAAMRFTHVQRFVTNASSSMTNLYPGLQLNHPLARWTQARRRV